MIIEYLYPAYDFIKKTQRELKAVKGLTNEESGGIVLYEQSWYGLITLRRFVEIPNVKGIYYSSDKTDFYMPEGLQYRKEIEAGLKCGYQIGDWHTHFGNTTPSSIDDDTMMNKAKINRKAMMIIISEDHSKLFIYKKDRIKTQIL